ncbi:hypothetical protein [Teichococcus vastitatis]|uniref:hypothetical protein n=1 Tax=Teichococcus vastitatis TaxID=2307076 RepID=UPI000E7136B0|nr:hypothetical protein [Pseudoroseomonas vastitatis]
MVVGGSDGQTCGVGSGLERLRAEAAELEQQVAQRRQALAALEAELARLRATPEGQGAAGGAPNR